ncbi:MAG: phosphatase PAP2 family protein [Pseudomonadota bacterium]
MVSPDPTWRRRGLHLLVNALAFSVCYPLANRAAQERGVARHLVTALDGALPFLPWMILPYLSSGLLFGLAFALVRGADALRVLSARLLLATVCACLVFVLFPLQFSLPRPPVTAPVPAALFDYLALFDRPYNQLPSLHVAFCVILWAALRCRLRHRLARAALAGWLMLVALSTLFTYQHHLLDVPAGALLGLAAVWLLRPGAARPGAARPDVARSGVAFYYLMAAAVLWLVGVLLLDCMALLYGVASLLLVSLAYRRADRHFLHKRDGRFPAWVWLMYAPYLAGYRLSWHAVRWHGRARPPLRRMAPLLWVGRRLDDSEAALLPADCTVIDLANELSATPALRAHRLYHFPLLDLAPPPPAVIADIVTLMLAETRRGRPVYLHCAMGYSRSIFIANDYLDRLAP